MGQFAAPRFRPCNRMGSLTSTRIDGKLGKSETPEINKTHRAVGLIRTYFCLTSLYTRLPKSIFVESEL